MKNMATSARRLTKKTPTSMSLFSLQKQYIPKQIYDENIEIHQLGDIRRNIL